MILDNFIYLSVSHTHSSGCHHFASITYPTRWAKCCLCVRVGDKSLRSCSQQHRNFVFPTGYHILAQLPEVNDCGSTEGHSVFQQMVNFWNFLDSNVRQKRLFFFPSSKCRACSISLALVADWLRHTWNLTRPPPPLYIYSFPPLRLCVFFSSNFVIWIFLSRSPCFIFILSIYL